MHGASAVEKNNIQSVFHITKVDNLLGIAQFGLQSRNRAWSLHNPTDISLPSVQYLRQDKRDPIYDRPLHDYVPLYFRARNPMLYRLKTQQPRLSVLYVDSKVLLGARVVFTDGNAASKETKFFNGLDDLRQIDWDCLQAENWTSFPDGKRKRCAEVLVPDQVPYDLISRVVVSNNKAKDESEEARLLPWPVDVREKWFF